MWNDNGHTGQITYDGGTVIFSSRVGICYASNSRVETEKAAYYETFRHGHQFQFGL